MTASSWLLVAFPALGALILLLAGKRARPWGHLLGSATVSLSFVYGLILFFTADTKATADVKLFSWIPVSALQVDFGLRIDALSLTFVLLITGVGMLIHFYSIGYMAEDRDRSRFFAYLNLFVASMLILVLGNSFVTLYLGWEGVGLASYLLIGWYQDRPSAATAAKKAFLMNRVGDVGLALAIFLMFKYVGSTGYAEVFGAVGQIPTGAVTAIAILLLLGACGKSGQFPLQAWLPDAMEGPTPVSALIHAATMVTAGVYLVARAHEIFNATADGRLIVTLVGTVTLLIGCIIGCAYDDIKKVLAYSTVSQIGYMMLAVGLGPIAYALGIMHLVAHGFFKAGLFLGAGSVMHAMNDEVDMRKYGGLRKHMPVTFWTFALGYLALIGIPPLSGFFTKDAIIEAALSQGGWRGWVMGGAALLGAGLTAFYMTRLMVMTFFGKERWKEIKSSDGRDFHPHESPAIMKWPMIILAIGSIGAGAFFALGDRFAEWLSPVVGPLEEGGHSVIPHALVPILTVALSVLGAAAAWLFVGRKDVPVERPERVSAVVKAARNDLYGNTLNETLVARPGTWLARALVYVDNRGVDGAVNGLAAALGGGSGRLRRLQTGFVRSYALSMLGGTFLLLAALLLVRFS
ncbi:NADH dehydrogenase subunit L [Amycolatopsis lurida]|uniref:NADH-quinone oxidoreductase subunit L n=1 Tax=Amycolatopsis lurida NRRL 2430 TaxID=1460371 RepID=A0A2P2FVH0_AMYLU|nr:NADH-quinone oxidoreductase subunit L [Amycolatopsis lurida]KFU80731.1 NADH-quinone oxidoreductase subunit L [Amycolatopsis lurida NRRL 2430]SED43264.1 NADH dehydrogenase subunit L [Amycolatopsis lurida]